MPSCSHTGTPRHFHSSTTSGSASFINVRTRLSISPRQSPRSTILWSINCDGDLLLFDSLFGMRPFLPDCSRSRLLRLRWGAAARSWSVAVEAIEHLTQAGVARPDEAQCDAGKVDVVVVLLL